MPEAVRTTNHAPRSLLLSKIARFINTTLSLLSPAASNTVNPSHISNAVTFSSQLCAASRAYESRRPPEVRLFNDPYAEQLAGPEAMSVMAQRRKQTDRVYIPRIPIRTRYFDDFVEHHLETAGAYRVQMVSLAAGLETRAFRLRMSEAVSVFEVDCQEVLERKERILGGLMPKPVLQAGNRSLVVADLSKRGWERGLELQGFDRDLRTVWVIEGLLYYLQRERVTALLKEVFEMSSTGSVAVMSVVSKLRRKIGGGDSETAAKNSDAVGKLAAMFVSDMPAPRELMEEIGWEVLAVDRLGGENADFGLWSEACPNVESNTVYVSARKT